MSEFTIRADIPAPSVTKGAPRRTGYPFEVLQPGQMFVVPIGASVVDKVVGKLKGAANRWKKSAGKPEHKFVVRPCVLPDDPMGTTVVGVWRTA